MKSILRYHRAEAGDPESPGKCGLLARLREPYHGKDARRQSLRVRQILPNCLEGGSGQMPQNLRKSVQNSEKNVTIGLARG